MVARFPEFHVDGGIACGISHYKNCMKPKHLTTRRTIITRLAGGEYAAAPTQAAPAAAGPTEEPDPPRCVPVVADLPR